jgi:hypothetical protein
LSGVPTERIISIPIKVQDIYYVGINNRDLPSRQGAEISSEIGTSSRSITGSIYRVQSGLMVTPALTEPECR